MAINGLVALYPLNRNGNDVTGNGFNAVVSPHVQFRTDRGISYAAFVTSGAYCSLPTVLPRYANNYTLMGWINKQGYHNIDEQPSDFGVVVGRLSVRHSDGTLAFWFYYDSAGAADNQG